ncbi:hypothetical protein V5O48_019712 [Marasmius crinis-equi]|uniref:Uncharacterized protein n=1 Tax=Marasmius crinis-equi TaxID=585013 RepID=A0ABR3EHM7_9AGAR
MYAPEGDPVFELVPPIFGAVIKAAWAKIDGIDPTYETFWGLYLSLLNEVRTAAAEIGEQIQAAAAKENKVFTVHMDVIPGEKWHPVVPLSAALAFPEEEEVYLVDSFSDDDKNEGYDVLAEALLDPDEDPVDPAIQFEEELEFTLPVPLT